MYSSLQGPLWRPLIPVLTAQRSDTRGKAFMSYDVVFEDAEKMPSGLVSEDLLARRFTDAREVVRRSQLEVALALNHYLSREADEWRPVGRKLIQALPDLLVKPGIRGVTINSRAIAPTLVNPRRSVKWNAFLPRFLTRGGYELHVRDDASATDFLILDFSQGDRGEPRSVRSVYYSECDPISIEEFEAIMNRFMEAVSLSKFAVKVPKGLPPLDLFRKR